ncbi:MAG: AraC family transcriptional regulator [Lachnospiraceae bacterium]|nr:AraC family transcriptional regulator [Lachnospiraceae bacterium]
MAKSKSNRILATPSEHAKKHLLYVQEVGSLESIEPHISTRQNLNSYLFFIVTSGRGTLVYEKEVHNLETGDCVWIDCRKQYAHESSVTEPWNLTWVHFNGNQADYYYQYFLTQGCHFIFKPYDLSFFTNCIADIYRTQKEEKALMELETNQYLTDLITYCFQANKQEDTEMTSISNKLQQVREYIEAHAIEKLSLDQLSEQFFISKYHLSREYKNRYGITIGTALNSKRIAMAKSQLRFSTDPIEQICMACGFQDAAYFIKVFKKAEGMTPLEYRKKW